ncbi:MAG: nitroreductase [Dehalococcoidia bacterium]|nr:nitroreductase [Dehalococcoidia bacterium]
MEIIEAINLRYSVRAFKPDPVPRHILEELLTVSQRSPSWANTQTWEFAVVGGAVMDDLGKALADRAFAQDARNADIPYPEWTGKYKERRGRNGIRLYEHMGIAREDVEKQLNWFVSMYRFFDAPNAIYIYTERDISDWAIMNVGLLAQTISLAALHYGLGSILLAAGVSYPDTARQKLNIPESKQILLSIAIGYPDPDARVNKFRTERVPLSEICSWHGF